jgi:Protein of unknown function (DUF3237)
VAYVTGTLSGHSPGSLTFRHQREITHPPMFAHGHRDHSGLTKSPIVVYSAPRFDAGDERYKWLSRIQVVGKGSFDEGLSSIDYEFFGLR